MNAPIHGKYQNGAIRPDRPLDLPDGTNLALVVTVVGRAGPPRPSAPKFSVEELRSRIERSAVSIGSLPSGFSRADIYQDHD